MKYATYVDPKRKFRLKHIDPNAHDAFEDMDDARAVAETSLRTERLGELQERLYAENRRSVLVILQALDTAGKDGVLRHVVGPLDSRGVNVVSFKAPNDEEAAHDFLWRVHRHTPRRGQMVFFNRSHYEDVLVPRVLGKIDKRTWTRRYEHIRAFESQLTDAGTRIVKIYLHISRDEQKKRLEARLADPEKHWKFDAADLEARARWDDYIAAYEDALHATSTEEAPWYVVSANQKWFRDLAVAFVLERLLHDMKPVYPKVEGFDPSAYVIED